MDDAARDAWRREVIAWAQAAAEALTRDGVTLGSVGSDWCCVLYDVDPAQCVGARWGARFERLPVVGDPLRSEAFERAALELVGEAYRGAGVARVAVYVGRLLVYAWAVAPEGDAEIIWFADGALRADVARRDEGEGAGRSDG